MLIWEYLRELPCTDNAECIHAVIDEVRKYKRLFAGDIECGSRLLKRSLA